MSWVAAAVTLGTAVIGATAKPKGGGGEGGAPAGIPSGNITFGDINLVPKPRTPGWLWPVVVGAVSVVGLIVYLIRRSRR